MVEEAPVVNNSNHPQELVKVQLGVTLYRMGQYGNGASLKDIAHVAGALKVQWSYIHSGAFVLLMLCTMPAYASQLLLTRSGKVLDR